MTVKKKLEQGNRLEEIRFIPYQTEEAAQLLGEEYHPGIPSLAYRVDQDGTIYRGLEAFLPLLSGLKWGKPVLLLWRIPLFRHLAKGAYRVVAKYRYHWFGTVNHD